MLTSGSAHEAALAPLVSAMQFDWIRREEALSRLIALFEQNGIRAAFLKGIVWAETLYQRPLTARRRISTFLSQNETRYTFTKSCSTRATVTETTHTHLRPMSLVITHEMTPIHFKSMYIGLFATFMLKSQ